MTPLARVEQVVDALAAQHPHRAALIYRTHRWTYAQVQAEMDRRAAVLVNAGLHAGDVVAVNELVTDETALAFFACCRAALTFFPIPTKLSSIEIAARMRDARVACVLTATGEAHPADPTIPSLPIALPGPERPEARAEAVRRSMLRGAENVAALILTSGTTGSVPKLVCTPHRTMTWLRSISPPADRSSESYYLPQSSLFSLRRFCEDFATGGTVILSQALDPARMEAELAEYQATTLRTVPAVVRLLTEQRERPRDRLALRCIRTAAAPLPVWVQRAAADRYGVPVISEYGSSEGGSMLGMWEGIAPDGSVGKPYPCVQMRVVDDRGLDVDDDAIGELVVRAPGLMLGYLDNPDATAAALRDGWLWTGDLATRDAEGFYWIIGRRALRINVGGFKVAPEEVEAILEAHPAVREAAVAGVTDEGRGEVVCAMIVARSETPSVWELRRWCRTRLASYKVPRVWEFRDQLPRSVSGKLLRQRL